MTDSLTPLRRLTEELVALGGPLASLVSHMQATAHTNGDDASAINDILAGLIEPTIAGVTDGWPAERLGDVADVLHAACERICADILIVPAPNRAARRQARRRP